MQHQAQQVPRNAAVSQDINLEGFPFKLMSFFSYRNIHALFKAKITQKTHEYYGKIFYFPKPDVQLPARKSKRAAYL